jgi:hypothetical protein
MVVEKLSALIEGYEMRRESVVCEGVHLSLDMVISLMERHPSMIPFLIHISNEAKHRERFAVSASPYFWVHFFPLFADLQCKKYWELIKSTGGDLR